MNWYSVIKTIKGHPYLYLQRTYRKGGRVCTESRYIGRFGDLEIRDVPKVLYRGIGKDNPNINQMAFGTHFTDDPNTAQEFGVAVIEQNIEGARVADLDKVKALYAISGILADPQKISLQLAKQGYDYARGTLPGYGHEYIKLEKPGWNSAGDWMPGEAIEWFGADVPEEAKYVIADCVDDFGEATGEYGLYTGKAKLIKGGFPSIEAVRLFADQLRAGM
jgi:hypothetical protein